ncbi:hypothetical protein F4814DRAFT_412675 [Daldinia grandis]|nr:hypothetical protein F4814DRAFT_412675 [Daldinia grandis]
MERKHQLILYSTRLAFYIVSSTLCTYQGICTVRVLWAILWVMLGTYLSGHLHR